MAIRRKRKTVTNVLSNMDKRIRSTELRQIKTGVIAASELLTDYGTIQSIGTVVSASAPSDYIKIIGGYYYSKQVTGTTDRVELYFDTSLGASDGDTIGVYSIRSPYTIDGQFVAISVDAPTGGDRPSWIEPLPVGATNSVLFSAGLDISVSSGVELVTKYQVYSTQATTTTATITFTTDHNFEAGDLINVAELDNPYPGIDGIYTVASVPASDQITFTFASEIASPIALNVISGTQYIYAVAQKYAAVGDTWIDTGTDPSVTYYWDGLRWSSSRVESVADSVAPANVTSVSDTTEGYTVDGGIPRSRVTLSWTAPTQDANGGSLTDLAGYEVWARYDASGDWTVKTGVLSADTSTVIEDLNQNVTVYFRIFAIDSSLNRSTGTDYSTTTGVFALELDAPSQPSVESRLGVVTVSWDGTDLNGSLPPASIRSIEVHASTTSGFTPGTSTLRGTMLAAKDNYFAITDLDYGTIASPTDWYIKLVAVDANGNKTGGSTETFTRVARVAGDDITANTITANNLQVGYLEASLVAGEVLRAESSTSNAFVEFTSTTFRAVNDAGVDTFRVYVSNGTTVIGAGTEISGNSITSGTINASSVNVININADNINTGNINANLITTGTLNANLITTGSLSANRISGGSIDATNVTITNLNASNITTGSLSGNLVTGGTITGTTLTTANTGQRVILQSNRMDLHNGSAITGSIYGSVQGSNPATYIDGNACVLNSTYGNFFVGATGVYGANFSSEFDIISVSGSITRNVLIGGGTTGASITNGGNFVRTSSSQRYKTDIQLLTINLDDLYSLEPKTFKRIDEVEEDGENARVYPGLIAEELAGTSLDKFVFYSQDEEGNPQPEGIHYPELTAALLVALKDQKNTLANLEARIAALEGTT